MTCLACTAHTLLQSHSLQAHATACLLALLQVASGAEEVVQNTTVVEQLQDALADTVGERLTDQLTAVAVRKRSAVAYMHCRELTALLTAVAPVDCLRPAVAAAAAVVRRQHRVYAASRSYPLHARQRHRDAAEVPLIYHSSGPSTAAARSAWTAAPAAAATSPNAPTR